MADAGETLPGWPPLFQDAGAKEMHRRGAHAIRDVEDPRIRAHIDGDALDDRRDVAERDAPREIHVRQVCHARGDDIRRLDVDGAAEDHDAESAKSERARDGAVTLGRPAPLGNRRAGVNGDEHAVAERMDRGLGAEARLVGDGVEGQVRIPRWLSMRRKAREIEKRAHLVALAVVAARLGEETPPWSGGEADATRGAGRERDDRREPVVLLGVDDKVVAAREDGEEPVPQTVVVKDLAGEARRRDDVRVAALQQKIDLDLGPGAPHFAQQGQEEHGIADAAGADDENAAWRRGLHGTIPRQKAGERGERKAERLPEQRIEDFQDVGKEGHRARECTPLARQVRRFARSPRIGQDLATMLRRFEDGLSLREHGGPRGRGAILYIHGLGESGLSLEGIATRPELADWRHVVPDLPGYGRSLWPEEPMPLVAVADMLAARLRSWNAAPAVVLGHSMGGVVATLLGERHPDVVRAVIDVEGNKSLSDCTYSSRADADAREAFLGDGYRKLLDGIWELGADREPLRGYYASMRFADPRTLWLHSTELVAYSREEAMARRLAALGVPALYVAGVPEGAGPRTLALVEESGVPAAILEPAGHWPFLDQPDGFARAVADFLGQLSRS